MSARTPSGAGAPPSDSEILGELQRILREALGRALEAKPSDRLLDELALDSIEAITLAVELENRFRVKLGEQDAGGVSTVEELVALVRRRWLEAHALEGAAAPAAGAGT